ncbi:MAG: D-alanyl-D-alanine carboxypeptidase [Halieaceae bacterium]|jgi:D-alanyl-D-alanine carboxypeptidase (penicillin-binding protein 5/6)|nr:D-alanyl-D-alanine carboxypeptidase [Halieaceae bacterium]MDG1493871.1 D-alanyl-D-alanine carboxypeptidase [Luminiphilus sp.]MBT6263394.1 D-alanyl-D-alanine carboxypeptidase [Halieaceae bacterium]MBT6334017.1 D-alanyl-D-alanine carboxypeptidase [Halieaceae bacterium]MBT7340222.1 D-alanyl-D-alanine carboxypeptidase [Halieaceae bacterium]
MKSPALVALLVLFLSASATAVTLVPAPPGINADAYLLIDFATGEVLVEHNIDTRLPPASLTKLMTSYILAEEVDAGRLSLDDEVTVSRNAWSQNPKFRGSSLMWIEPGKSVTVGELEQGIAISSGNDATVAIAEHIAGSEEAFVALMNRYAEELALTATHFENTHGLPNSDHLTTARDLGSLAIATIRDHPDRYRVYRQQSYTYNDITQYNRNHLLREDPSVDGLKTGYTSVAGYGLVASAEREGMRLISVVLGSNSTRSRKAETRSLLNYGFRFYQNLEVVTGATSLGRTRVWKGNAEAIDGGLLESVTVIVPRTQAAAEVIATFDDPLQAPINKGDVVGQLQVLLDGELLLERPLQALQTVEAAGFFKRLWDGFLLWLSQIFSP